MLKIASRKHVSRVEDSNKIREKILVLGIKKKVEISKMNNEDTAF